MSERIPRTGSLPGRARAPSLTRPLDGRPLAGGFHQAHAEDLSGWQEDVEGLALHHMHRPVLEGAVRVIGDGGASAEVNLRPRVAEPGRARLRVAGDLGTSADGRERLAIRQPVGAL